MHLDVTHATIVAADLEHRRSIRQGMSLHNLIAKQSLSVALIDANAIIINIRERLTLNITNGIYHSGKLVFGNTWHPHHRQAGHGRYKQGENEVEHRLAQSHDRLKVMLHSFLRHLLNCRPAQSLRGICRSHLRVCQFHNTEKAVTQTIVFLLYNVRQVTRITFAVNPIAKPKPHKDKYNTSHQPKHQEAHSF